MPEIRLSIRCTEEELERWKSAARKLGRKHSPWIRDVLNAEATQVEQGKPGVKELAAKVDSLTRVVRDDADIPAIVVRSLFGDVSR